MKLKELDRNGNIAWSPKSVDNSYLVVGTAAQQIDSSFSSKSELEIFEYIPNEKGCDMPVVRSFAADSKFTKLLWGNVSNNDGVIVGGTETGSISIYDCKRLLDKTYVSDENVSVKREHKGPVHAMDFNKFQPNLLATGGAESDIFIWDLDKFEEPMTPGNKSQPFEEIRSLSWNHKVKHILGSTSTHRCQIWDLRKPDPIIKLSDTQMKMKCSKIVWHPEISTRLCVSSEDDHTPVIQLWDLRYIQCPFHTLHRHTKGIIDLEWCVDDPDILMSVGKDRQMICWNMSGNNTSSNSSDQTSEVIYEWQLDQELINEARFCPKHPGLVSVSSFDCHISLYSLMGGRGHVSRELSDSVIDSFPLEQNDEDFDDIERVKKEAEKAAELQLVATPCLSRAPKWLKRTCGASFSFGGRLVQFCKAESSRSRNNSVSQTGSVSTNENIYKIFISQVSTDKCLVDSSRVLDNATQDTDSLLHYCQDKIESITTDRRETDYRKSKSDSIFDLDIWRFIKCHFFEDSRSAFMQNLGYGNSTVEHIDNSLKDHDENCSKDNEQISSDESDDLTNEQFPFSASTINLLPRSDGIEKSLSVALMTGDIETAVDICLDENRSGEAAILAVSSGRQDLFEKVQMKVFNLSANQSLTTQLIYIAVKRNWHELVLKCDLNHWKEALAWLLTYAGTEELSELCETLGQRLEEQEKHDERHSLFNLPACICYICSGSINNFVRCWLKKNSFKSNHDLQRLMEVIVLLCKSVGDDEFSLIKGEATDIFRRYALLLVSQGNLSTALKYLGNNDDGNIIMLRHRICERLRNKLPTGIVAPKVPFKLNPILKSIPKQKVQSQMNVSVPSVTENMKMTNQVPDNLTRSPGYRVKQNSFSNNMPNSIMQPKPQTNEPQSNFVPNQFNCNPMPNMPSSIQNNMSMNYFQSSYPVAQPAVSAISQLPYVPQNVNNFVPMNAPPQIPIGNSVQNMQNIQKPNNQVSKCAWNDPPLLSENYRFETLKDDMKIQQNFFNPTAAVTNISDIPSFGNINTSGNMPNLGQPPLSHPMNASHTDSLPQLSNMSSTNEDESMSYMQSPVLSSEYEHIQLVLMNLIEKCRQTDKSRQVKVKMDDIQKKINILFEQLKFQPLSPELTNGLNTMISSLEANNFRQSFDEVNHIIQTVNFSEAGLFLPSVKMLIQCAIKIFE